MQELILHHYPGSPFAEKIRRILGYKGLEYRSVHIGPMLPRPQLAPLTGDYRRTPVLQVGADVYCDTRCIAAFLERAFPAPTLFPAGSRLSSDMMTHWAEAKMFVAMAPLRFRTAEDVDGLFEGRIDAAAFAADRAPFMRGALDVARIGELVPAAFDQVHTFLAVLERELDEAGPYLTGAAPSMADFSAFHLVWWLDRAPRVADVLDRHPRVCEWLRSIDEIGHGRARPMTAEEALAEARSAAPRVDAIGHAGDPAGRAIGREVRVNADDYGRDPVVGELVSSTLDEVVLRRENRDVGTVHLHFPRIGFEILPT
jgi:glutathione S-transferase